VVITAYRDYFMFCLRGGTWYNKIFLFYCLLLLKWLPKAVLQSFQTLAVMTRHHALTKNPASRKGKGTHGIRIVKDLLLSKETGKVFHARMTITFLEFSHVNKCKVFTMYLILQSLISVANLTHISFGMIFNCQKAKLIGITHSH